MVTQFLAFDQLKFKELTAAMNAHPTMDHSPRSHLCKSRDWNYIYTSLVPLRTIPRHIHRSRELSVVLLGKMAEASTTSKLPVINDATKIMWSDFWEYRRDSPNGGHPSTLETEFVLSKKNSSPISRALVGKQVLYSKMVDSKTTEQTMDNTNQESIVLFLSRPGLEN